MAKTQSSDTKKPDAGLPNDADQNPGIGQSKGLFARAGAKESDLIEGENTVEGDRENDSGLGGGAGPKD